MPIEPPQTAPLDGLGALIDELAAIRDDLLRFEADCPAEMLEVSPAFAASARNLLHYLAFRSRDVRRLQEQLAELRVSSLGRAEPEVLESVTAVLALLQRLAGRRTDPPTRPFDGPGLLEAHTRALLGSRPRGRHTEIMVTMPTEAAAQPDLVREMVAAGMDVIRINCAYDGPDEWEAMIRNLRVAERELGTSCRVHMDLAGPKLRTGPGFPSKDRSILLRAGDRLMLTRELDRARLPERDSDGRLVRPGRIGCTLPAVFDRARPGQPVWFDDGKLGGVIDDVAPDRIEVRITTAPAKGRRLRSGKGINLPGTELGIPALTPVDLEHVPFVARHADTVGLSFVQRPSDVLELQWRLVDEGARRVAIVLKIETRMAFERLPGLLLAAMRASATGVMIARGDLAVECGYERLAEVQEEILWLCEAAHVPVIWATQVLESLAKTGRPSRAEITDAAMSERAECVMLNKGPRIVEAIRTLDDILTRMQGHQAKKRSLLRELRSWRTLV